MCDVCWLKALLALFEIAVRHFFAIKPNPKNSDRPIANVDEQYPGRDDLAEIRVAGERLCRNRLDLVRLSESWCRQSEQQRCSYAA
jgi:hypothetical protein